MIHNKLLLNKSLTRRSFAKFQILRKSFRIARIANRDKYTNIKSIGNIQLLSNFFAMEPGHLSYLKAKFNGLQRKK